MNTKSMYAHPGAAVTNLVAGGGTNAGTGFGRNGAYNSGGKRAVGLQTRSACQMVDVADQTLVPVQGYSEGDLELQQLGGAIAVKLNIVTHTPALGRNLPSTWRARERERGLVNLSSTTGTRPS